MYQKIRPVITFLFCRIGVSGRGFSEGDLEIMKAIVKASPSAGVRLAQVPKPQIAPDELLGREIFATWYRMENLLKSGAVDILPAVTHTLPLADYRKTFTMIN
jgi:threonine dehydrogenase-like Zn-dependent dehydrogenase